MPSIKTKPSKPTEGLKMQVREYWDRTPCGTENILSPSGSREFFERIEHERYSLMPYLPRVLGFADWKGKRVLEVGCGAGTDLLQFARNGALVTGIELNRESVGLTKKRLELEQVQARLVEGDAENLPFPDASFDMVYSFGVIHHTPDTQKALDEIYRVLAPGGRMQVMIYHLKSWAVAKIILKWGLLKGELFTYGFQGLLNRRTEGVPLSNPLTKVYTVAQARRMASRFNNLQSQVMTCYCDEKGLPGWLTRIFQDKLGWFLIIKGNK